MLGEAGKSARCPDLESLSRALDERPAWLATHLASCASCTRAAVELDELGELGRDVPWSRAAEGEALATRDRILAATAPRASHRVWPSHLLAAAATVCALVLGVLVLHRTQVHVLRARSADYELAGAALRLHEGTVLLEVRGLPPGGSFAVRTVDASVVVHGTRFEVEAREDRLSSVRVEEGVVEVQRSGAPSVWLRPGGRWFSPAASRATAPAGANEKERSAEPAGGERAPETPAPQQVRGDAVHGPRRRTVAALHEPASPGATAREPAPASSEGADRGEPAAPGPSPIEDEESPPAATGEEAFVAGWDALRAGDAARAARLLGEVPAEAPLAEDASFVRALALQRAGREDDGVAALRRFLEDHPGSAHEGMAVVLLAEALLRQHRSAEALELLRRAEQDPDPDVRERARRASRELGP